MLNSKKCVGTKLIILLGTGLKPETKNWIDAAEYDLESAHKMFISGRYLYVIFLCHLTLEKMLKAIVTEVHAKPAPRSHDLIYLLKQADLAPESQDLEFIGKVNNASIPTRYPSDIRQAIREYNKDVAKEYLRRTEEVVAWLRKQIDLKK